MRLPFIAALVGYLSDPPRKKRLRRSGRSSYESLEARIVPATNLYHVLILNTDMRLEAGGGVAPYSSVHGTASYAGGFAGFILADSMEDAAAKVVSGTVTSDEDETCDFSSSAPPDSEDSAFTFGIGSGDGSGGNATITFHDPLGEGSENPYYDLLPGEDGRYGYGGWFDLKITQLTSFQDPPCVCYQTFAGAPGATGDSPPTNGSSAGGINNTTGQLNVAVASASKTSIGTEFGNTLRLNNQPLLSNVNSDNDVTITEMPRLLHLDDNVYAVAGAGQIRYFDKSGSNFVERDIPADSLVEDSEHGVFVFSDSAGDSYLFEDFDSSLPVLRRGALSKIVDAGGNVAEVAGDGETPAWNSHGQPNFVKLTSTDGGVTTVSTYHYVYEGATNLNDVDAQEVSSVTLSRQVGTDDPYDLERESYEYYGESSPFAGKLEYARIEDPTGSGFQTVDTTYLRYDDAGNVSLIFANGSYTQLWAKYSSETDPKAAIEGADDTDISDYADMALTYNENDQVIDAVSKGTGCSVCAGGMGHFTYEYATSSGTDGYNTWKYWMDETLPDGSHQKVFANFAGEVILTSKEVGSQKWITVFQYDSHGRLVEADSPAAVSGYTFEDGVLSFTLNNTAGLITHTDYWNADTDSIGATTTIASSTSTNAPATDSEGGADGYVKDHWIEEGAHGRYTGGGVTATGHWTYTDFTQYFNVKAQFTDTMTDIGANFWLEQHPIATTTVYSQQYQATSPSLSATGASTTAYSYVFIDDHLWVQQLTEKLPDVSGTSDQQGSTGSDDEITNLFDIHGRPVWVRDAKGLISHFEYDTATGALVKEIDDCSTGLPTGWSATSGSHLNLTSVNILDQLGRTVISIDPYSHATFTAFYQIADPDNADAPTVSEVRLYEGWTYTSGTGGYTNPANYSQDTSSTRPPVAVAFDNLAFTTTSGDDTIGKLYSETLTMTQIARVVPSTGVPGTVYSEHGITLPIGGEPIADVKSLTLAIQNQAGQVVESNDYYAIPDLSSDISNAGDSDSTSVLAAIESDHTPAGTAWNPASPTTTANYYSTVFAYDNEGLQNKTYTPNGTLYRTVHDSLGRVTSVWAGTEDTSGSYEGHYWTVANAIATEGHVGDLVELAAYVYDNGNDGGNSDLTMTVEFPDGSDASTSAKVAAFRVVETTYDWMDRPVNIKSGVAVSYSTSSSGAVPVEGTGGYLVDAPSSEGTSGDKTQRPIIHLKYDNLGVTEQDIYAGNGHALAEVSDSGISGHPSGDTLLRAEEKYYFDGRGREYKTEVFNVIQTSGSGGSAYATSRTYFDANDEVKQLKDPLSNYTTFTYDGVGRLLTQLDPNKSDGSDSGGAQTSYLYADDGHVEVTDPNGKVWKSYFDAAGRLIEADQPALNVLESGTTNASISPESQSTSLYVSGAIPKTTYVYGDDGLLATIRDPNSNLPSASAYYTTYSHDALGRTTSIQRPAANLLSSGALNSYSASSGTPTVGYSYDGDGNVVAYTNENGGVTHFAVDKFDNVIAVAPPGETLSTSTPGKGAIYAYNNLGERLSVQTADGTTTFDYNTLGQQWKITRPSIDYLLSSGSTGNTNPVTSLTFDALGNVASSTDADGSAASTPYSTTYTHDGLSRLTGVTAPAPSGSGSGLPTSYGYNLDSELTSVTDPLGNVTSIAYWANGLKKSIQLPNPSDGSSTGGTSVPVYQYDYTAAGQLETVTDPFSNVTTYGYSETGQLSSVTGRTARFVFMPHCDSSAFRFGEGVWFARI